MFLAVQLESRLIYCLNKACLTATASVISHRTVLTGSRPLGGAEGEEGGKDQFNRPRPAAPPSVFGVVVAQLGPRYRSHLMERGLGNPE